MKFIFSNYFLRVKKHPYENVKLINVYFLVVKMGQLYIMVMLVLLMTRLLKMEICGKLIVFFCTNLFYCTLYFVYDFFTVVETNIFLLCKIIICCQRWNTFLNKKVLYLFNTVNFFRFASKISAIKMIWESSFFCSKMGYIFMF